MQNAANASAIGLGRARRRAGAGSFRQHRSCDRGANVSAPRTARDPALNPALTPPDAIRAELDRLGESAVADISFQRRDRSSARRGCTSPAANDRIINGGTVAVHFILAILPLRAI